MNYSCLNFRRSTAMSLWVTMSIQKFFTLRAAKSYKHAAWKFFSTAWLRVNTDCPRKRFVWMWKKLQMGLGTTQWRRASTLMTDASVAAVSPQTRNSLPRVDGAATVKCGVSQTVNYEQSWKGIRTESWTLGSTRWLARSTLMALTSQLLQLTDLSNCGAWTQTTSFRSQ